jgi:hypothetical protein
MLIVNETSRERLSKLSISEVYQSSSCEWEHTNKKSYCKPCREEGVKLRKRPALEEISENATKKRRSSQTRWQCKRAADAVVRRKNAGELYIVA